MKNKTRQIIRILILVAFGSGIGILFLKRDKTPVEPAIRDYAEIAADSILRVATEYNTVSYRVEGDTVGGFNYELIHAFAQSRGWKLTIIPEMDFNKRLSALQEGHCDILANHTLATAELKDSFLLTHPIVLSRQVLVQRKDSTAVKSQLDLARRTLHIVAGSPIVSRIRHLSNEIADTIYIREIEKYGPEQLIAMVAHGDIDYAVCDEHIARAAADSLPIIDAETAISFTQFYSWAVNKKSPALRDSLNAWLDTFKSTREYKRIYQKYY